LGKLVSNAIQYTPPQGSVTVSAGAEAHEVWIQVSDTGPGIPAEEQEQLFTPFYRGAASGRFPQGMGLGLSIARDLVTAHGGRLTVESTPGLFYYIEGWYNRWRLHSSLAYESPEVFEQLYHQRQEVGLAPYPRK
jgi:signal transduction histidine kinase